MSTKRSIGILILLLTIGLALCACAEGAAAVPEATDPPLTAALPTATDIPTDTPVPPTLTGPPATPTPLPPTPTEPPPTTTPTEEPIALNPSPRAWFLMAYDSESKQVILFGGQTGDPFVDPSHLKSDTWAFDVISQTWVKMNPTESPRGRDTCCLAYDSESDRIILFGGGMGNRDTWAYDYNTDTWTAMKARGPTKLIGPRMAYDAESDQVILFGGLDYQNPEYYHDETWAYDYNTDTWNEMKPDISPIGQNDHGMTYDTAADRIILWGGYNWIQQPTHDHPPMDSSVWAYDFNTNAWQEKESSSAPGPRATHAMAYADSVGKVFMYGGTENGTREFRSYDYNSNTWEHIEEPIPFPGTRSRFAMVYIPDTDQLVVFGGQIGSQCYKYTNETWVYDVTTNTWTNVTREEP